VTTVKIPTCWIECGLIVTHVTEAFISLAHSDPMSAAVATMIAAIAAAICKR
jgi:hypothetical protein